MRNKSQNYKNNFLNIQKYIEKEILNIEELKNNNLNIIPEINFNDLETHWEFYYWSKKRGCVVIRDVFEDSMMNKMNTELEDYIEENNYYEDQKKKQILIIILVILNRQASDVGLYWSKLR